MRLVGESRVVLLLLSLTQDCKRRRETAKDQQNLDSIDHFSTQGRKGAKAQRLAARRLRRGRRRRLLVKVAWWGKLYTTPTSLPDGLERVTITAFCRLKGDRALYLLLHLLPMAFDAVARARLLLLRPAVSGKEVRTLLGALARRMAFKAALRISSDGLFVRLVTESLQRFCAGLHGIQFGHYDLSSEP